MKRFFSALLVAVLIPCLCFADDFSFAGIWSVFIPYKLLATGNLSLTLVLNEDGTMAVTNVQTAGTEEMYTNTKTGTWLSSDSSVSLSLSDDENNTFMILDYKDGYLWIPLDHYRIGMTKTADFTLDQYQFYGD